MTSTATTTLARYLGRELLEPLHLVTYMCDAPNEAMAAIGFDDGQYWPLYFAGRAAPLGQVPAAVVDAIFFNFAPGMAEEFYTGVWDVATPAEALAAREAGSVKALRGILGSLADSPAIARAADLALRLAFDAPLEGRPLYAGLRTIAVPTEPLARLWHAATLLREHRGDGHNAALVAAGINGQEAHVFAALDGGMTPRAYGRLDPLTDAQLEAVVAGLRERGLVGADDRFTALGRELKDRIEEQTDLAAAPAYASLTADELDQFIADLKPLAARIETVGYDALVA
ncbi:MarR family transcriptional regulator [Kribbella antibiotica]|uniref:MarR family transcriptional regulator n=1 Tax=Kribbella antibiotica TaxID=190195 RepID=A0A4R4YJI9_9ACTN|nr:MarR family transcriptional regulator [Kribbella antibiotica]TDD45105.1 MarR family transcriptional regulator [Kribbella antibiotica]